MVFQFLKFSVFGIFTAFVYFGLYIGLVSMIMPILATAIAFVVSVVISYLLNSIFVFNAGKGSFKVFFFIALSGLFFNMLIILIFTELILKNSTIAGIIVLILIPLHNFFLNYKFNFR